MSKSITIRYRINLTFGIISVFLSLLIWILIPSQIDPQRVDITRIATNPQYVPRLFTILVFINGCILILQSLIFKKDETKEIHLSDEIRVFSFIFLVVVYALMLEPIGFLISALFLVNTIMVLLRIKNKRFYLYGTLFVLFVYVALVLILKMSLPKGILSWII